VSTKNWWFEVGSYDRTQPSGRGLWRSSIDRRANGGTPFFSCGTSRCEEDVFLWGFEDVVDEPVATEYDGGGSGGVDIITLPKGLFLDV
jgi:hypothetical protein